MSDFRPSLETHPHLFAPNEVRYLAQYLPRLDGEGAAAYIERLRFYATTDAAKTHPRPKRPAAPPSDPKPPPPPRLPTIKDQVAAICLPNQVSIDEVVAQLSNVRIKTVRRALYANGFKSDGHGNWSRSDA